MERIMKGAILPGNSTVRMKEFDIPHPGYGQVLVKTKASTICGSDIRAIYHAHTGRGAEGYRDGIIAGHEPAGIIAEEGPGLKRFRKGDRVIVYHISGCGVCYDCRRGYYISCKSPYRAAYGWQRNGGMAPYVLCDEKDLIALPDELSYEDGAQVACGFGTTYEALMKIGVSGNDRVLVTGLGPVGLSALMLARAMGCDKTIGCDVSKDRRDLAVQLGLADVVFDSSDASACEKAVMEVTDGYGCERTVDCSGNSSARTLALRCTREWGKMVMVGEGGDVSFQPSPDLMHGQKTIYGSWVTSLWRMEELVEHLVRWGIHPDRLITHRFELKDADKAYELMASGKCGKVAVVFPD